MKLSKWNILLCLAFAFSGCVESSGENEVKTPTQPNSAQEDKKDRGPAVSRQQLSEFEKLAVGTWQSECMKLGPGKNVILFLTFNSGGRGECTSQKFADENCSTDMQEKGPVSFKYVVDSFENAKAQITKDEHEISDFSFENETVLSIRNEGKWYKFYKM